MAKRTNIGIRRRGCNDSCPLRALYGAIRAVRPNKRLKLPGAGRSKGSGVLCPWRGTDYVHRPYATERVARSLSAIR